MILLIIFLFIGDTLPTTSDFLNSSYFHGKISGKLHVRRSAYILAETEQTLIGKLSRRDMTVQGAKYHATCLVDLCRRADRFQQEHLAFGKVISFIEESIDFRDCGEDAVIFKLSELIKIYTRELQELNVKITSRVHIARLKERILC